MTPSPSSIDSSKPSHAEDSLVVSPAKLSSLVSAILSAAPLAFIKDCSSPPISSEPLDSVKNVFPAITPTKSIASFKGSAAPLILAIPSSRVKPFLFNSIKVFASPVPAMDPLSPLSAKTPSNAVVFSIDTPVALETGATNLSDSLSVSKSNAELLVLLAMTSTTLAVSLTSKPKDLTKLPDKAAASPRPTSKDAAKLSIDDVDASISVVENPNLPSSVCNSTT